MSEWCLQHPWMTLLIAFWAIEGVQRTGKNIRAFLLEWKRIQEVPHEPQV